MHPMQLQHKQQREERIASQVKSKAWLLQKMAVNKLRFVHLRKLVHTDDGWEQGHKGGATVAYHVLSGGKQALVSVAWCHPHECYNKFMGRLVATRNYINHEYIMVRLPANTHASSMLRTMFSATL